MSLSLSNDPVLLVALTTAVFFLAGCMKGIIGMGLPTLAMALLGIFMTTYEAAALLVLPAFVTNVWQFLSGPSGISMADSIRLIGRLKFMLIGQAAGVVVIWRLFHDADAAQLSVALGAALLVYSAIGLFGIKITLSPRHQPIGAPIAGTASGMITGATGTMVIPSVMYLQTLDLNRDKLVQAMGLSFSTSSLVLAAMLFGAGKLDGNATGLGLLALAAAAAGMPFGQFLRSRLSESMFRQVFFVVIGLIGISLIVRNLA